MAASKVTEFVATGRRKSAVARVRLAVGSGKIVVNGRSVENYFPTEVLRGMVAQPFNTSQTANKFDTRVNVAGGGPAGQAGAVRHGISRALLLASPAGSIRRGFLFSQPATFGFKVGPGIL